MAERELKLTITVDGKTATKTLSLTDAELQQVRESARAAGRTMSETLSASLSDVSGRARKTAKDLGTASESIESASDAAKAANRTFSRAGDTIGKAGSQSGQAAQFIFGLGDAAQDARYGIEAVGNNIALAAEQAADLITQTGSARGALSSLSAAVIGPAGAVLALQALLALGPEIVDFFQGSGRAAAKFEEDVRSAAEGMFDVAEEIGSFEAATLQQAEAVESRLETMVKSRSQTVEELQGLSDALSTQAGNQNFAGGAAAEQAAFDVEQLRDRLGLQDASLQRVNALLDAERERLAVQKGALATVQQQVEATRQQQLLAEEFRRQGLSPSDVSPEQRQSIAEAEFERRSLQIEAMDEGLERTLAQIDLDVDRQIEAYRAKYGDEYPALFAELSRLLETQRAKLREEALSVEIPLARISPPELQSAGDVNLNEQLKLNASGYRELLESGSLDTINEVDNALSALQEQLGNASTEAARAELRLLIQRLEEARSKMQGLGTESELTVQTVASAVAGIAGNMATALRDIYEASGQQSKAAFAAFKAFAIAEAIASTYLAANKALASAPPPFNYALAASVVAAGLANVAKIAATGPGGGGTAAGSRSTQTGERDLEGGGEATASVPGFARGVDSFAGGMAIVGEEGPETVVLPPLANVLTNENTRTMNGAISALSEATSPRNNSQSAPNVTVPVSVNARSGSLADLIDFDVVTEIERKQRDKARYYD